MNTLHEQHVFWCFTLSQLSACVVHMSRPTYPAVLARFSSLSFTIHHYYIALRYSMF